MRFIWTAPEEIATIIPIPSDENMFNTAQTFDGMPPYYCPDPEGCGVTSFFLPCAPRSLPFYPEGLNHTHGSVPLHLGWRPVADHMRMREGLATLDEDAAPSGFLHLPHTHMICDWAPPEVKRRMVADEDYTVTQFRLSHGLMRALRVRAIPRKTL
jgi:hypothetical protein